MQKAKRLALTLMSLSLFGGALFHASQASALGVKTGIVSPCMPGGGDYDPDFDED